MGLKESFAPLDDIIGLGKLQALLLSVLDAMDGQEDRLATLTKEVADIRGHTTDNSRSITALEQHTVHQDMNIKEATKKVADMGGTVTKAHAEVQELWLEAKGGAAGAKDLADKLDEMRDYKARIRELEANMHLMKEVKPSMDHLARELREEVDNMAKRITAKTPAVTKEVYQNVKYELTETVDGLAKVGHRLVAMEARLDAVEQQPRLRFPLTLHDEGLSPIIQDDGPADQAAVDIAGDFGQGGSPTSPSMAMGAEVSFDGSVDILSRFSTLSKKAVRLELVIQKQELAIAKLQDQCKMGNLSLESLRSEIQSRNERFAQEFRKQEGDFTNLQEKVERDLSEQIDSCVKKQELDLTSMTDSVDGLRGELAHILETFKQDSGATVRCLTCHEARKQAAYPTQVGTDGKQYRKRPSTAGEGGGPRKSSPERADLNAAPLDMWLNSPGKTGLRQQMPTVAPTKALKGAHRSLLCSRGMRPSSTTPVLGLTDAAPPPWKATLLATEPGSGRAMHPDGEGGLLPPVEIDGPDLRLAHGVRSPSPLQKHQQQTAPAA